MNQHHEEVSTVPHACGCGSARGTMPILLAEPTPEPAGIPVNYEAKGVKQGRQLEALAMLERMLTRRFGALPEAIRQRMQGVSAEIIETWFDRAMDAQSLQDVFGDIRG